MFVRIKKQLLTSEDSTPNYSLRVLIVESYRDKGAPRQKIVKYLGSIQKKDLRSRADKHEFVQKMNQKIEEIRQLSFKQQTAIKLSLVRAIYHIP